MTGAEQTPQERLAEVIEDWLGTDSLNAAAAILDSDVIREIKAEAWAQGVTARRYAIEPASPYGEVTGT